MKPLLSLLTVGQQSNSGKVCWYDKHILIHARGRIWVYPEEWNCRTISRYIKTNQPIFTMYPIVERYRDKFKPGLYTFTVDGFYSRVLQPDRILIYKPLDLITSECPEFAPLVYLQLPDGYVFDYVDHHHYHRYDVNYTVYGFIRLTILNIRTGQQYGKYVEYPLFEPTSTFKKWLAIPAMSPFINFTIDVTAIVG